MFWVGRGRLLLLDIRKGLEVGDSFKANGAEVRPQGWLCYFWGFATTHDTTVTIRNRQRSQKRQICTTGHDYSFTISLPINVIARAWLFHFLPIPERHVERNLVYSPENAKKMAIRQCAEEPSLRNMIPTMPKEFRSRMRNEPLTAQSRRRQHSSANVESNRYTPKKYHEFCQGLRDQKCLPTLSEAPSQRASKMFQSKCISHCQLNAALPS